MDDFELELKRDFISEGLLNLDEVESAFMDLESSDDRAPLLQKIFRMAHNLKGGARAVGFPDVAEFTHHLENLVLKIQKNEVTFNGHLISVLLKSNDRLVEMLTACKADLNAKFQNGDLITEIEEIIAKGLQADAVPEAAPISSTDEVLPQSLVEETLPPPPPAEEIFAFPKQFRDSAKAAASAEPMAPAPLTAEPIPPPMAAAPKGGDSGPRDPGRTDEVVRVPLARIDKLNDLVGELIIWQTMAQNQAFEHSSPRLNRSMQEILKLAKEAQELSMGLRLLPVKPLVQKLQRAVRDTAQALGKEIEFLVQGETMEIDKTVLDRLTDPLIHIVRNAVDHGIEDKASRTRSGKSTRGQVRLSFRSEGNFLFVEVQDDGGGIDPEKLRVKAIEKGVIVANANLTEKQLIHLIFHPGFSTKSVTSEISGRGVGMDVVKTNIEKAGGTVEIQTKVGGGSQFVIRVPLSMAVIDGLVTLAEKGRYILPLSQVQETLNLSSHKVQPPAPGMMAAIDLRGEVVPLVSLYEIMSGQKVEVRTDQIAIVVRVEDRTMGLVIDDIVRSQQIVIKPLVGGVAAKPGWLGTCILGDGLPTLILSPIDILRDRIQKVSLSSQTRKGVA